MQIYHNLMYEFNWSEHSWIMSHIINDILVGCCIYNKLRNDSWSHEQKSDYINSLLLGLTFSPILIFDEAFDFGIEEYIVIDGYERINAIYEYSHNLFPVIFNGKYTFYHSINDDNKALYPNARIMSGAEKRLFDNIRLTFIMFDRLCYDDRLMIYSKVNNVPIMNTIIKAEDLKATYHEIIHRPNTFFTKYYFNRSIDKSPDPIHLSKCFDYFGYIVKDDEDPVDIYKKIMDKYATYHKLFY